MKNKIYRVIHIFYAYTVACGLGLLVNLAFLFLARLIFTSSSAKEVLELYIGNDGWYFAFVTFALGLLFFRYTKKLDIV